MAKCCYYQFFPRATALVLVMSGLLYAVHWFLYASIASILPDEYERPSGYVHVVFWVLLPVTGWVAESWLGRYRAIVVGLILSFALILTLQAVFVMLQFEWTQIPAITIVFHGFTDRHIWYWQLLYYYATFRS